MQNDESTSCLVDGPYTKEFNSRLLIDEQAQKQLNQQHQQSPFNPWDGLLVIRFSDNTTIQTNWVKLASPIEKMRRDGTTISAILQITSSDDNQKNKNLIIGSGLIPCMGRKKSYVSQSQTRMMSRQSGRVYYNNNNNYEEDDEDEDWHRITNDIIHHCGNKEEEEEEEDAC